MGFHGFGLCWFESVVLSDKKKATTSNQESPECPLNKGNPGDQFLISFFFPNFFRVCFYCCIFAATAINTAATDKIVAGRKCTAFVLSDMPEGKYGTKFDQDQKSPAGKSYVKATVKQHRQISYECYVLIYQVCSIHFYVEKIIRDLNFDFLVSVAPEAFAIDYPIVDNRAQVSCRKSEVPRQFCASL